MASENIIRKISIPHCARGPKLCEKCKEAAKSKKICLLEIFLEPGNIARPTIEVIKNGEPHYYEFEIVKVFSTEQDAKEFAAKNNIDISLN
ncbi:MAG: hypothetical protein ACTSQI_15320 [Candidatus Helarchaeota archaeon]